MSEELPHKLHKTLLGTYNVKYLCPKCKRTLENPLAEAGREDACPNCNAVFKVPGKTAQMQQATQRQKGKAATENDAKSKREQSSRNQQSEAMRLEEEHAERIRVAEAMEAMKRLSEENTRQFIQKNHTGYVYRVEQFHSNFQDCTTNLSKFINHFSEQGWEYVEYIEVKFWDPAGCLASFLGQPGIARTVHIVTFKRPALRDENGDIIPFKQ
jgi:DNA-directed RNA polymerase subunit RPC12/RpoP